MEAVGSANVQSVATQESLNEGEVGKIRVAARDGYRESLAFGGEDFNSNNLDSRVRTACKHNQEVIRVEVSDLR